MKRRFLVITIFISVIISGCGEEYKVYTPPLTKYVFEDNPIAGNKVILTEDKTFYAAPTDDIPVSVGDVQDYPNGFNGVYIETLDDNLKDYASTELQITHMTEEDKRLIKMSEEEAWIMCSSSIFDSYPKQPYREIADLVSAIKEENTEDIVVKCWYWEDPSNDTNMNKITVDKKFTVNKAVAQLFTHIFEDIYECADQPIINIGDGAMGTWVLRGKNHNDNNTLSAHSIGTAIDINPSTGSYNIGGVWYGNGYGQNVMTTDIWNNLPESHQKYHVLYDNSSIVKVFKAYGFYWGGDWNSTKDNMHFGYIGDGSGREVGLNNYIQSGGN